MLWPRERSAANACGNPDIRVQISLSGMEGLVVQTRSNLKQYLSIRPSVQMHSYAHSQRFVTALVHRYLRSFDLDSDATSEAVA